MAKQLRIALAVLGITSVQIVAASPDGFVCPPASKSSLYSATTKYLGCYTDSDTRTLRDVKTDDPDNTPQDCATFCGNLGYKYSAVEYTTQCFCGNQITAPGAKANDEAKCSYDCPGDSTKKCGATYFMNLYQITNPNPNPPPPQTRRTPLCQTVPFCSLKACDKSLPIEERVKSLISKYTTSEKIKNLINVAVGVPRLGVPRYNWWNEALHGVAASPGVSFDNGSDAGYATSFPTPILLGASFDDELVHNVGTVIGREARAFGNGLHSGLDFWTPNINTFNDPRWGRGWEVATEDALHMQGYVASIIPGLQGGNDLTSKQIIATCKHYAVYDVETNRMGQNYNPTQQDLAEYYFAPFKTCIRDSGAGSIMCSYNAVDGVPACASEYLLQDVLRDHWGFGTAPYRYVASDCDANQNIYSPHNFTDSAAAAAAVALNAGTDLDCGINYRTLNISLANKWVTEATIDKALTRLYLGLSTVGYFDGQPQYDSLSFKDVNTKSAQALAYESAVQGMTLLKNDGTLPLKSFKSAALIGPWANATDQMITKGLYAGIPPYLNSPLSAAQKHFSTVNYAFGTAVNGTNTTGFAKALSAARSSDVIFFMGGIDTPLEGESNDRTAITWPGNQLELISQLSELGKPLIVVQFGGGQVDDSALLKNKNVNALLWGGYPGQDGGPAVIDIIVGKKSPAGRLPVTQYPASYVDQVSIFDPDLRPGKNNPGRTYKWYSKTPVLPFGHGLHYTNFTFKPVSSLSKSYDIASLVKNAKNDAALFDTMKVSVTNTGKITSDYVALLFVKSTAGPQPYPNKSLVAYTRAKNLAAGQTQTLDLKMTLASIARADENGDMTLFPGRYDLELDINATVKVSFELTGQPTVIDKLPRRKDKYSYTVPVHPQK